MNWEKFFTFIGWFLLCFLACSFIGLLIIGVVLGLCFLLQYNIFIGLLFVGVIVGIVLLIDFNIYVAAGIIIGIIALCMTIDIMKED